MLERIDQVDPLLKRRKKMLNCKTCLSGEVKKFDSEIYLKLEEMRPS